MTSAEAVLAKMHATSWVIGAASWSATYNAGFEQGITEIGCMPRARRKFFNLHVANKTQLAEQALHSISGLFEVKRQARDMSDEDRWRRRQVWRY